MPTPMSQLPLLSVTDSWATPDDFYTRCNQAFGPFDLDVAADATNAKCARYYTSEQNGLTLPWSGRVWCNPPYSSIRPWVDRANECEAERVVMLVPAWSTDSRWWHAANAERVFIPGRL